jgi:tRNA U34 5-carboxymethylaminomethyl modifying GTPase MnmE/TrmE
VELPPETPVWVLVNKIDLVGSDRPDATAAPTFVRREGTATGGGVIARSVSDEAIQLWRAEREAGLLGFARNDEAPRSRVGAPAERQGENEAVPTNVERTLPISCVTGEGLTDLLGALEQRLAGLVAGGETALVAEARQRRALQDAAASLRAAGAEERTELLAENLRRATDALGRITGRIDVEQVLDAVFSRFCIGK